MPGESYENVFILLLNVHSSNTVLDSCISPYANAFCLVAPTDSKLGVGVASQKEAHQDIHIAMSSLGE